MSERAAPPAAPGEASPPGPRPSGPRRPRHPRARLALFVVVTLALGGVLAFWLQLQSLRERSRTGPEWTFPSIVYSDRVRLRAGEPLPLNYLVAHLDARDYRREGGSPREPGTWEPVPGGLEIFLRGFADAPDPEGTGGPERVRVKLEGGRVTAVERLGGVPGGLPPDSLHPPALEPVRVATLADSHRVMRRWVPLSRIPKVVRDAVISSEDRRFYSHHGVDLIGLTRAMVSNVRAGGVREGGSTLSQQLARGLWLGRERSVRRKVTEAVLATLLEAFLSKDRILEMYLNSVYWGHDEGVSVSGIAEAAHWYFGCPPESLRLEQAALLTAIIPAPNAYTPLRHPGLARSRRDRVLDEMVRAGRLDSTAAAAAKRRPLGLHPGGVPPELCLSYSDWVRERLARELPRRTIEGHGLSIFTPLDLVWQLGAQRELPDAIAAIEPWPRSEGARLEGAFIALDPATGRVRALLGGRDPGSGDFNRATRALRQPGSAAKPILYAAAIETRASRFEPDSTVPDLQRVFHTALGDWSPRNAKNEYHPSVTLAYALAHSLNLATIELTERLGPGNAVPYFDRLGLGHAEAVLSVGLGTHEVTPLALTSAYATFDAGGVWHEPTPLRAVVDGRGRALRLRPPASREVFSARTAALTRGMLEGVTVFGTGAGVRSAVGDRVIAGKTGTTNENRDGWFVGFTPTLAAGAWVGYDAPRSLTRSAAGSALPVWARLVRRMLDGFPREEFTDPPGMERILVDAWTGALAREDCPKRITVLVLKSDRPRATCASDHHRDWLRIWFGDAADSVASAVGDTTLSADSLARFLAPPEPPQSPEPRSR